MPSDPQDIDVFDSILDLEDQYYAEGYALGVADGEHSGRVEGRVFGLEKGFEKFLQMGKLGGWAAVWSARLPSSSPKVDGEESTSRIPQLKGSERLKRHVERLSSLADPQEFSTENSEEAVSEVDGRLKEGLTKATLIAKIIGEDDSIVAISTEASTADVESNSTLRIRRDGDQSNNKKGQSREMEDFTGLP